MFYLAESGIETAENASTAKLAKNCLVRGSWHVGFDLYRRGCCRMWMFPPMSECDETFHRAYICVL